MQNSDLPALSTDEQAVLEWALDAEREYRTRSAHRDGVLDRCSGLPFNPMAHPDHHAPVIWAGNPAWQAIYEQTNWRQLYEDAYRDGWIQGGKGHVLVVKQVHFPSKEAGQPSERFLDGLGYRWYPAETLSNSVWQCDGCGAVYTRGWCRDLPGGTVEKRCQRCVRIIQTHPERPHPGRYHPPTVAQLQADIRYYQGKLRLFERLQDPEREAALRSLLSAASEELTFARQRENACQRGQRDRLA